MAWDSDSKGARKIPSKLAEAKKENIISMVSKNI